MNSQTLIDAITNTLEDANWNVSPYKDPHGIGLEIETWTDGTDYDYIGNIDMRGNDTTDPDAWIREANECYEAFNPEEEALLWVGGKGAPSLRDMLDDFDDFKANRLAQLPKLVEEAVNRCREENAR